MAKDDAAARIGKVVKLLDALNELRNKETAILEELETIAAGGPGIGSIVREVIVCYADAWKTRYKTGYVWQASKDVPQIKRLIKELGQDALLARVKVYFANHDPFFVMRRHAFGLFVVTINQHVPELAPGAFHFDEGLAGVVGCSHYPRCGSDALHTKKRRDELQATF